MNANQIMNKKRIENLSWEEVANLIAEFYGLENCWIDPMTNQYFKLYNIGSFPTKEAAMMRFRIETKHLKVSNVIFWGSERFGIPAHDYKITFEIVGGAE